ncbi:MAG: class I SAM-dependent methyltransferase [Ignavibacteriales bacterium]|nr:MAG: class I SAM-dependent methyltransferase [Ignavibacteriales bacterium]
MQQKWNDRYSTEEYIFGTEPNQFLKDELEKIKPGKILLIAEGEGRNAVYAAKSGWQVDAIDFSSVAKEKALKLAAKNKVSINYEIHDLAEYTPPKNLYDVIGIFYLHIPIELREDVLRKAIDALTLSGKLILEVFEKEQVNKKTFGPSDPEVLYSLEDIAVNCIDLDFEKFTKEAVFLDEGDGHKGEGIVIRFVGVKTF